MDCFQDFCLACDRESVDGHYCSQACRLADLEKANADLSPPSSPSSAVTRMSGSGYVLPPRFTTFKSQTTSPHSTQRSDAIFASSYQPTEARQSLSPSSSRTSLNSTTSVSSQVNGGMSEQARLELQTYFSSFDQARAAKRRSSTR